MKTLGKEQLEALVLASEMAGEDVDAGEELSPPDHAPTAVVDEFWEPDLNPTQRKIFDDTSLFILTSSEKSSGKTIGCLHKLVRHCYENFNAFAIIIAPTVFTGSEGAWGELERLVLPTWKEGNRHSLLTKDLKPNPLAGELKDNGIGLQFTDTRMDPLTKDKTIWIGNVHGGWSKVMLKSIPHGKMVSARLKGPTPSFVYVEELTDCESAEYFKVPAAQLGRRRDITGPQQFVASCNPKGPSHWVYKQWMEMCVVAKGGKVWHDGIRRDSRFAYYHVPARENQHRLPPGYMENNVVLVYKDDPVEIMRLAQGVWVDRPDGEAIFRAVWDKNLHVVGDARRGTGIIPHRGHTIILGFDPGPANFCVSFMQLIPVKPKGKDEEQLVWLVFDEVNFVGKRVPYFQVVPVILQRMDFWRNHPKCSYDYKFEHIIDEAAYTIDKAGSCDAADIKRLSNDRIHPKPCPKGKDSKPARVRLVMEFLQQGTLFVSARCVKTIEMFEYLESEKAKDGEHDALQGFRPKRSIYLHPFDATSYPMFYYNAGAWRHVARTDAVTPQVYTAGGF